MILPEFGNFIEAYGAAGMLRGFGATEYARQFLNMRLSLRLERLLRRAIPNLTPMRPNISLAFC